jgi:hypothetical protein
MEQCLNARRFASATESVRLDASPQPDTFVMHKRPTPNPTRALPIQARGGIVIKESMRTSPVDACFTVCALLGGSDQVL